MLQGLSTASAEEILARDGLNRLTPPKGTPEIVKFLLLMAGGFSIVFWIASALCFLAYGLQVAQDPAVSKDNVSITVNVRLFMPFVFNMPSVPH